jgi:hypothetical protein
MRALLLLLLLLLAPQAVAAGDGWVSISDLDFSKCKPGDAHQSFSIESMDSVGTIKDEATKPLSGGERVHRHGRAYGSQQV